ncbi:MAG TPA: HAMP domain-containing histidine kinase [Chloroflexi bacterium]|nr:HAMP domain-containing histidine kinase [Chloroflexota bacterium]
MTTEPAKKIFEANEIDEAQDLRSTFYFAGLLILGLAALILTSSNRIAALQIPPTELGLIVIAALAITTCGLIALQMGVAVRLVSWCSLTLYTIILTFAVHYTGGPQTPFPAVYLVIVLGASFLLGRKGATMIALLSVLCYAAVLYLEYKGILPMIQIWGMQFSPQERGSLLIINWITLSIPTLITSQLAGSLAERLRQTNSNLRESERLRDNLSHMIVHDLRNPITALMGGLDILRMTLLDKMNDDQKQLLENARRSGHVLIGLVGEILDISKMEAGKFKLNIEPVNLCKLIEESVDGNRALAEIEDISLEITTCSAANAIPCDRQLISRVLANLISNAIKHTPAEGTITVSANHIPSTEQVIVSVSDTGVGIPPEYQKLIFEKFGQVQRQGGRQGTGLGLTFCKMTVEEHGGEIWVESQVGQGSTFSFSLPLKQLAN